jgi:hypothetical protein
MTQLFTGEDESAEPYLAGKPPSGSRRAVIDLVGDVLLLRGHKTIDYL